MFKAMKHWWNTLNQIFYFRFGFTYSDIHLTFRIMTLGFTVAFSIPDIFHNLWIYEIIYMKHYDNKRAWHDLSFSGALHTGISIDITKESREFMVGLFGLIYTYHHDLIENNQD